MTCKNRPCTAHVPEDRIAAGSPFCSPRCRRADVRRRQPSRKRYRQRRRQKQMGPYQWFIAATEPRKRLTVTEDDASQRQARMLISRGMCAYENARGLIRDIGVARELGDRSRVWSQAKVAA